MVVNPRYVSRRVYPRIRWVDLDRPLKKQLEKYSRNNQYYINKQVLRLAVGAQWANNDQYSKYNIVNIVYIIIVNII